MIEIKRRKKRPPNVSIAALVDCVFLLLIFFLLTSTYSSRRGLKIELPGASTAEAADRHRIEVAHPSYFNCLPIPQLISLHWRPIPTVILPKVTACPNLMLNGF